MSNRYHNDFHPVSDSHFGSQFSLGSSQNGRIYDDLHRSNYDLNYDGHFVPPNDVGVYEMGDKTRIDEVKYCWCTIL
ncbi:hypothetical protein TcasGA2_TC006638 [Tribolium castaneum]|uniref:Uncharacterized protein n=1 Tax=Tribolium castaneum TaxID=7070 RepID=D6WY17_TRICA|nr:hypothetical protein TcasGA2_TC006638 [Tribolium castaneum]